MPNGQFIDLAFLRSIISPQRALLLHGWKPVCTRGGQLRGPCPFHKSRSTSSVILGVSDRVFYCHKCHATGDAVECHKRLTGLATLQAAWDLCDRLGINPPLL